MRRFEYKTQYVPTIVSSGYLNELGKDGWELVAIHDRSLIFKRELPKKTIGGPR